MKKYKIYQVDAFTDQLFGGNPAAVCPLDEWLDNNLLLKIAMENNLSETAFYVKRNNHYEIKWFTPTVEVNLCGHATLATAFVLFTCEGHSGNNIHLHSHRSGSLGVRRVPGQSQTSERSKSSADWFTLDFPVDEIRQVPIAGELSHCFDKKPIAAYKGQSDYLLLFENETDIAQIQPDLTLISKVNARGVIITARGEGVDFVSRFFAPQVGVAEDPVTGSAHTTLTPYWAEKLKKTELTAVQLSERRGYLQCKLLGNRVEISGQAKLYLAGEIYLEDDH